MKKILVPCDFSKQASNAYRYALDVARKSKGKVFLLHVIELPMLHDSVLMPVLSFEQQLFEELEEKSDKSFQKLMDKIPAGGVDVVTQVKFGQVHAMIIDYAKDHDVDLIVMGSHGVSGVREIFLGSNAEKIVRNAHVPVLVVKQYSDKPVKNIVFPHTLETIDQELLVSKVKALQNFFDATIHLVWINTPVNFSSDITNGARLQAFAKRFMLKDYTVNVFNHTDEEEGILHFTKSIDADLIAMGTHGRKGLAHVFNGSVAEDVVNHSRCMVWTYSLKAEPVQA